MKILALSDTHKKIDHAIQICRSIKDIDMVVHLGDCKSDGDQLAKAVGIDVIAVKGNCDGSLNDRDYQIIDTQYGKIVLTHGHMQSVKQGLLNLFYFTKSLGCKAAFFGHTHIPCIEEMNGIYLINPGSLTLPACGSQGSYAIITVSQNALCADILYYNKNELSNQITSGSKPKVSGGYLRNILNNSDRF